MAKAQIRLIFDGIDKAVEKAVKSVTLAVTAELIRATPVDTGWARANWVPSIGVSFKGNSSPSSKKGRQAATPSAAAAQSAGTAKVATGYKVSMGAVFVSNNVPYLVELDRGSSTQAPSGFVRASIIKAVKGVA
jgi:hypothetical protein